MHFSQAQLCLVFVLMHFSIAAESLGLGLVLREHWDCSEHNECGGDERVTAYPMSERVAG